VTTAEANADPSQSARTPLSNKWICGFLKRYDLCVHQRTTARLEADRRDPAIATFIQSFHMLVSRHRIPPEQVINMDETGIWFDMSATRTVNMIGSRQVPIRRVRASNNRFTAVIAVTASGAILCPVVIF
jgi:hypothetical protein